MPFDPRFFQDHNLAMAQPEVPAGCLRLSRLLNVRVDDITAEHLVDLIARRVLDRGRMVVVNANVHLVNLARTRPWLVTLFNEADVAFCDGRGVQLALWLQDGRKPARHTPPEWINALAQRLAAQDATVFWLGGQPLIVERAARVLEARTGIRVVGFHHGFFNKTPDCSENEAVVAAINRTSPDVLLINMGMPTQEQWLFDNWHKLDARVAITAGALVDHVAGCVRRPPLWVTELGLEWLVRLAIEPRRLWRRYLVGLPVFAARFAAATPRYRSRSRKTLVEPSRKEGLDSAEA